MRITIPTPPDFSFIACVESHGWRRLQPFRWIDEPVPTLERVEEFGNGQISRLKIRESEAGVEVESTEAVPEDELARRTQKMLQLDKGISEFHDFCLCDTNLSHIPSKRQGRLLRSPTVFEDVIKVLCTTNTTWKQTIGMVSRLVENFGAVAERDQSLRAFPTPDRIAKCSLTEFSEKGKMGYRAVHAYRIACGVADGAIDLEALDSADLDQTTLYKKLLELPGIGPYAASCLMIYLGRYERVNVDSWARMMVSKELGRPVNDKDVHDFFSKYGDWKALIYLFYPWKEDEPAY